MEEYKSSYINNEVSNSLNQIENNKNLSIGAIKIYLLIFFGLFTYAAFLQTKIIGDSSIPIPSDKYFMFAVFGVVMTVMTSTMGWILLDYITGLIYKSIINYKHIGHMRNLSSKLFFNDELKNHCVLPVGGSIIHLQRTRHLPLVFSILNMLLLSMNYYFLQTAFTPKTALTISYLIIFIFAVFFPNACKKLEEEKMIAQKMKPGATDESIIRDSLTKLKERKRKEKTFKAFWYTLVLLSAMFLMLIVYNVYHGANNNLASLSNWIFAIEGIFIIAIAFINYHLAMLETSKS
jgi:hypothetical protein